MDFIKESHGRKRCLMAGITIHNEPNRQENLDRQCRSCYKEIVRPGESRAPLQRGVASAAGGCRDAIVKTGFGPGRVGNVQARPLPIG